MFEDRYGYDDDEFESEPVPMRRVPVYTVLATNTNQERALAVVTNLGGAAPSLTIREPLVQQQGSPVIQERRQVGTDGELASISSESDATARYRNTYGYLAHRMAGQGTSTNPNPPQPGLPLERPREQAAVVNQAPVANQVTPVAAEVYERQIANIQRRLDQQPALQRRLDEHDQLLRQQEAALELRSRENQQRHQSLIGCGGHIDPANLFNTPLEHQAGGNPVVQTTGRAAQNPPVLV